MSTLISTRRKFPKKARWGVAAAIVAAGATSASLALAQVVAPPPDGGPVDPPVAPIETTCGASTPLTVITQNTPRSTNATAFQTLPGASKSIVVPDGQSRCIKVLFTAESACSGPLAADFCYVRAMAGNQPMNPDGTGFQALDSEDVSASAHAYEWVKRVGPGVYNVRIEWRVGAAGTTFDIDDWTMDIQIYL